jgi:glycosyltransferase domain-containing protein
MRSTSQPRYTLVIPTYNRPACLRSLLGYLAARGFKYPILVLDSSTSEQVSENEATISATTLNIAHRIYNPATPVGVKFADGAKAVETRYCSFCADDDVLLTDCLDDCLDVLDAGPAFVAAHGYYINLNPADTFEISEIVYAAPSIAANDAVKRIVQQMSNYQAIFYAIHRTGVMQSVLLELERVQSLLAQELLSSSLTLISGSVYRLPRFYMARNTGPSIASEGWHPHQILATSPQRLFDEYAAYRAVILEHLRADAHCSSRYRPEQIERIIDVVHLKYLAPMLSPPIMDYIIDQSMLPGHESSDIVRGLWKTFASPPQRVAPHWSKLWLHYLKRAFRAAQVVFADAHRLKRLARMLRREEQLAASPEFGLNQLCVKRPTRNARQRQYLLSRQFLEQLLPDGKRVDASEIASMLRQLDHYV